MNTKLIAATCIALALSRWSATHAYAEVTFPDALQGQWCLSSSFKKAPGDPVPHTVCMQISPTEFSYNRAEDTVKRLTSLSPNTWRVEFDNGTTATWRAWRRNG